MKALSCSKYFFLECLGLFLEKNQHKNSMEKKKRLEALFQQKHQSFHFFLGHTKSKGNRTRDRTESCRSASAGLLSNPCTTLQKHFKKEESYCYTAVIWDQAEISPKPCRLLWASSFHLWLISPPAPSWLLYTIQYSETNKASRKASLAKPVIKIQN